MVSQAVIHFVGLVVLAQVGGMSTLKVSTASNRPQLMAILPRVETPQGMAKHVVPVKPKTQRSENAATVIDLSAVETHKARIIYERFGVVSSGWTINHLDAQYDYIDLNGDRVSFVADQPNQPATRPAALAHLKGTLRSDFASPSYAGTAAIIDIPVGDLSVCVSQAPGTVGRRDTELRLNTSGTITIKSGTKTLTLPNEAEIYVVNAPDAWEHTNDAGANSTNHFWVYCAMTGTEGNCQLPTPAAHQDCINPPCAACEGNREQTPHDGDGDAKSTRIASNNQPAAHPSGPPPIVAVTSFECSNTQWP